MRPLLNRLGLEGGGIAAKPFLSPKFFLSSFFSLRGELSVPLLGCELVAGDDVKANPCTILVAFAEVGVGERMDFDWPGTDVDVKFNEDVEPFTFPKGAPERYGREEEVMIFIFCPLVFESLVATMPLWITGTSELNPSKSSGAPSRDGREGGSLKEVVEEDGTGIGIGDVGGK